MHMYLVRKFSCKKLFVRNAPKIKTKAFSENSKHFTTLEKVTCYAIMTNNWNFVAYLTITSFQDYEIFCQNEAHILM